MKLFDIKAASLIFNPDNFGFRFCTFKVWSIWGNVESCINSSDFSFDGSLIKIDVRNTIECFLLIFLF